MIQLNVELNKYDAHFHLLTLLTVKISSNLKVCFILLLNVNALTWEEY